MSKEANLSFLSAFKSKYGQFIIPAENLQEFYGGAYHEETLEEYSSLMSSGACGGGKTKDGCLTAPGSSNRC